MSRVFVYWDNSNIYARAKSVARREGSAARARVRINFGGLMDLAFAGREGRAVVAASIPPSPEEALWNRMTGLRQRVDTLKRFDRGDHRGKEQEVPDLRLQVRMMGDALDFPNSPGVAVLLTGDGKGGFRRALERMHRLGWGVELLAWKSGCNTKMREWVEENGVFVPLDDYYEAVTFLDAPRYSVRLHERRRQAAGLDLSRRPMSTPRPVVSGKF